MNYLFINIIGIRYFKKKHGYEISNLEFSRFGFPITNTGKDTTEIFKGSAKGKKGNYWLML